MRTCSARSLARVAIVCLLVTAFQSQVRAAEPAVEARISDLIAQLEAKRFAERQAAYRQLLALGQVAIPQLRQAMASDSREVAARARSIVVDFYRQRLPAEFRELSDTPDDEIDLEHGMWLISRLGNPIVPRESLDRQLDALAKRVQAALGNKNPKTADPQVVMRILTRVIFQEEKFAGNTENYRHPDNSSLERVLATRKGLPILLSHVLVSVAQRCDIPVVGIGVPSRYMAKYDGDHAPVGFPKKDILVDPFGGRLIQEDDVHRMIGGFDPQVHLVPSNRRATLVRMLTNLVYHFQAVGDTEAAQQTEAYRLMLAEKLPDD